VEGAIDQLSSKISIRGLQVLGAICLSRFCAAQGIRHRGIDALLKQLWKIATVDSIMDWQRERQKLEVAGRGDPLPASFAEMLEEPLRSDFERLVNRVGEISDVNMFRDPTDRAASRHRLAEAMEILECYGVPPPEQAPFEKSPPGWRGWGRPVRPELLAMWRSLDRSAAGANEERWPRR
jgi:hypothetical protein